MRAAVYHGREEVRIEEVRDPSPAPGEVVIEIARAGICGTDLHEYLAGPMHAAPGVIMGHEYSGTVVATGPQVDESGRRRPRVRGRGLRLRPMRPVRARRRSAVRRRRFHRFRGQRGSGPLRGAARQGVVPDPRGDQFRPSCCRRTDRVGLPRRAQKSAGSG